MPVFRIEFTAKGYLDIQANDEDTAYETALDQVNNMSSHTFMYVFEDNVEVTEVECIEGDPEIDTSFERYIDSDCV